MTESRVCLICGDVYYKKVNESKDTFKNRKYCSYKCTFVAQRKNKHWRSEYSGNSKTL
jgi:hypothetical protein